MNEDDWKNSNSGSCPSGARPRRAAAAAAALAVTALLAAACSGGGSSGSSSDQDTTAQLAAFASCMRSHGESSFSFTRQTGAPSAPPAGSGAIVQADFNGYTVEFDPQSPAFEAAKKKCQQLARLIGFNSTPPRASHQQFLKELKSVDCLRSHGYPNYPDPPHVLMGQFMPVGVDTSSPQFQAAVKKCGMP